MAEELNVHFSSVFTREDTSSLPVPETKFNGSEEEKLGQLVVTPEVVASKINNMKENKSPGVDVSHLHTCLNTICPPRRHPIIYTSVVHDWANSNKNVEKSSIFLSGDERNYRYR